MIWTSSGNGSPIHLKKWLKLHSSLFATGDAQQSLSFSCPHLHKILYEIQLFCNFTPCISVDVVFLERHFTFVEKTKINSLFVPLIILPFELKETFCQTFFAKFSLLSNFTNIKVFFMFYFCTTLLLGVLGCYAQYDFAGFFSY